VENNKHAAQLPIIQQDLLDHKHVEAIFCSKPSITSNHRASVGNYGRGGIIDLVAIVSIVSNHYILDCWWWWTDVCKCSCWTEKKYSNCATFLKYNIMLTINMLKLSLYIHFSS